MMKLQKYTFRFEPENPITTPKEFTNELIKYCDSTNKELYIIHEGMEPVVLIDDIKYLGILEQPKMIDIPILPIYFVQSFGFKWVYLYEYDKA